MVLCRWCDSMCDNRTCPCPHHEFAEALADQAREDAIIDCELSEVDW